MHDAFIRPYGGDFLVVIFMYCFVKSFVNLPPFQIAAPVLIFSYLVECSQYFGLIYKLGLEDAFLAHLILGSTFKWMDMVAYTLGILLVLLLEGTTREKEIQRIIKS
jgi:hypothetical protein